MSEFKMIRQSYVDQMLEQPLDVFIQWFVEHMKDVYEYPVNGDLDMVIDMQRLLTKRFEKEVK